MKKIFPHLSLTLGVMVLTFFCIDRVNDVMAFMTSELSKWVIAGLALTSIVTSVLLIIANIRESARQARLEEKRAKLKLRERRSPKNAE
ncbi:MAG: hypothetical protein Q4C53_02385 [Clostridia bacterium]|nr:hypothetical protein [Clostridia bacterium]